MTSSKLPAYPQLVINLSHKLEKLNNDSDSILNGIYKDHPEKVQGIENFIRKILAVPKRAWFLLFVV